MKGFKKQYINKRNLVFFLIVLIIEVGIARYVRNSLIRGYGGDILVVPLIYNFIRIFSHGDRNKTICFVVSFAIFVEILQFYKIVEVIGIESRFLRIAIGNTFDFKDVICYLIGGLLVYLFNF